MMHAVVDGVHFFRPIERHNNNTIVAAVNGHTLVIFLFQHGSPQISNSLPQQRHWCKSKAIDLLVQTGGTRYINGMENGAKTLKIAMAQLNPTVGAVAANAALLRSIRAASGDADVIVAGELFLTGYPPEDLVLKRAFLAHVAEEAEKLVTDTAEGGPALIFGLPVVENGVLYNRLWSPMVAKRRCAIRCICPIMPCLMKNACLERAPCLSRWNCAGCASVCRFAKIFGLPMSARI